MAKKCAPPSTEQISRFGPESSVSAIVVGCRGDELAFLRELFGNAEWFLDDFSTLTEALIMLKRRPVDVVVASNDLSDGCWRVLLHAARMLAPAPPVIVTSRFADERLWVEVLNEGGYDVLAQPFNPEEVIRVVSAAARRKQNSRANGAPAAMAPGA